MKSALSICLPWLLASTAVLAQNPATTAPGFDCWIGDDSNVHYIRCIVDRDIPPEASSNERADALMESIHQELHRGTGAKAERVFKSNIELVRVSGAVWNIRIHSYPYEWSWKEGMPERLVRAALCPPGASCPVLIRR